MMNERNTPSLFDAALKLHREGRLNEADALYSTLLPTDPKAVDALHLRGVLRNQLGRSAEAVPFFETALKAKPGFAAAWSGLGTALHRLGRQPEALVAFEKCLVLRPNLAEALNNRGNVLRELKRPEEALASYDGAVAAKPDHVEALNNRGNALRDLRRPEEALASYDRALALKPDFPEILANRGHALRDLGRLLEALESYDKALALKPGQVDALFNRANALVSLRRPAEAVAGFDAVLVLRPNHAEALNNRGNALRSLERPEEALASYDRSLALRPDYVEALYNRGIALRDLHRREEALASFDLALALRPEHPEALNNRGTVLRDLNQAEAALASYDQAITLRPGYAIAHDNRGLTLAELGRLDEAVQAIETALALAPERAHGYYNLALLRRSWPPEDPHLQIMEALAAEMAALDPQDQIDLHFALAKAYEAAEPERAFRHFLDGNALKRQRVAYDEPAVLAALERIRGAYPASLLEARAGRGAASPVPVFILGMPRSGTTLVEQILASHPAVFGAGEIEDLAKAATKLSGPAARLIEAPELIAQVGDDDLHRLGTIYLERIRALAPEAQRITNKLPENFRLCGLIHLALPEARIIHTRRDPVDTCLSCFSQLFAGNLPYTYDLAELGRYYRGYDRLMAHWRAALPAGVMLEVHYEAVVADLETEARRIVAHCGLDWDPRCLDFHRTERQVRTASMNQVRQPLYKGSVGKARAYGGLLGPLLSALAD